MRRVYQLTGLAILLLAVFIGYQAASLRYYTSLGPGPGFFPLWLCVLLGGLALLVLVQASAGTPEPMPKDFVARPISYARIAAIVGGLVAVAALMNVVGFPLTMLAFFLLLLSILARRNVVETIALSIVGSFGIYHLFSDLLGVALPAGLFAF